jgi:divalent metal cation (Fe/Co/Zn/Cd) transporter
MALVISVIIGKIGLDIVRKSTKVLTDSAAVETARVAAILDQIPGVESYHHIRSRGQEDDIQLDLHVRVTPDLLLSQAHAIGHQAQRTITETIEGVRDVVVHVEPQPGEPPATSGGISTRVTDTARELGISVHRINAIEIAGRYSVDLHVEVPEGLSLGEAHAQVSKLEDALRARLPEVASVHTHIEPSPGRPRQCSESASNTDREQAVRILVASVPGVRV